MILFAPFLLIAYLTSLLSADVKNAREILELLSETDEMTGIKNRRAFNNTFALEAKKAKRYSRPFSILMIDADNLKTVNDQSGISTSLNSRSICSPVSIIDIAISAFSASSVLYPNFFRSR
ncbi:MAG: hypothetical protein ACI9XC_000872, partial [Gammaproteobacteria bacterium]